MRTNAYFKKASYNFWLFLEKIKSKLHTESIYMSSDEDCQLVRDYLHGKAIMLVSSTVCLNIEEESRKIRIAIGDQSGGTMKNRFIY